MTPPIPPKSALFIVWLVVFIDLLGFGIVLPVLPRLANQYLEGLPSEAKGAVIGILFSSFSLMQFLFSTVWGRISDRIGRRPVLLISLMGSVVFYALFGYAVTLPAEQAAIAIGLILAARIGAGISGASVGTAAAVIADCTTPEQRAKGMALIGIAFGAGFTFGPLLAYVGLGIFEEQRWSVGIFASILSAIAVVLAFFLLPETRNPAYKAGKDFFSISRTMDVLRMPSVGPLILIYFLGIFAFANFEATLALFTEAAFGMTDQQNFLVFAGVGAVLLVAGGSYRGLVKRRSELQLLTLAIGLMITGLGGLAIVAYGTHMLQQGMQQSLRTLFYLTCAVAVVGFAFMNPSVSALISRRSDPARQGEILGVNQACGSMGRILGPFLGSVLFGVHPSHVLPYVAACLTLFGVIALLPLLKQPAVEVPEPVATE